MSLGEYFKYKEILEGGSSSIITIIPLPLIREEDKGDGITLRESKGVR